MHTFLGKILVMLMAAVIAAAPGLCPCVEAAQGAAAQAAAAVAAEGQKPACSKGCNRQQSPEKPAPRPSEHCDGCMVMSDQTQKAYEPNQGVSAVLVNPALLPALFSLEAPVVSVAHRIESTSLPPLLNDLFHSSCLLTI